MKRIIIALSLYSRIPMPGFRWDEKDMKHAVDYLPLVGIIIALAEYAAYMLLEAAGADRIARIAIFSVIPLLIDGGFHLDGFMDVEDALQSYKSREDRLLIMKDPHIGAFAVIRLIVYALIWTAAMSLMLDYELDKFLIFILLFVEGRALTGLLSVSLVHAKKDGMLNMETSDNLSDRIILGLQLLVYLALMVYFNPFTTLCIVIASAVYILIFRGAMLKYFGGITGDTMGFFLVVYMEIMMVVIILGSVCGL